MDNYNLEIPYAEEDTCPDCGKETEKGYQCSSCIKRYEKEIRNQADMISHPCDEFIE